jgi:hypothetical protein
MRALLPVALTLALVCLGSGVALAADDSGFTHAASALGPVTPGNQDSDGSLTTIFASNNGFAGNSFDVTALTALTVVGWDVNLDAGTYTVEVYTKVGTADGFEQNAAAWTLLGSDTVVSAGPDLHTYVNVGGLTMASGDVRGVIVRVTSYSGIRYTNGGPNTYSNADMSITTYRGLSDGWPPSSLFVYRAWNGTVYYDFACSPVEPSTWGAIKTLF